jgi:hypothetical protein
MRRVPIAFFVMASLINISAAAAQQPKAEDSGALIDKAGIKFAQVAEYKPLTFWSKVALGSYFLTNSAAAHNINIVYAYAPNELKASEDPEVITKLLKEGTIKVGIESKDNKVVGYSLPEGTIGDGKALSDFVKINSIKGDFVYLAAKQDLLGATPTGALYTTSSPQWSANH